MNVDLGIWGKLTKVVWVLLIVAAVGAVVMWYQEPVRQNERMRKRIIQLDGEIQKQEAAAREAHASIEAMRDPKTVERIARDKLLYAKPDETVIRFETQTNSVIR